MMWAVVVHFVAKVIACHSDFLEMRDLVDNFYSNYPLKEEMELLRLVVGSIVRLEYQRRVFRAVNHKERGNHKLTDFDSLVDLCWNSALHV